MITGMTYIQQWELSILSPWPLQPFFLLGHYVRRFASRLKSFIMRIMKSALFRGNGFSGMTLSSNIYLYEE